MLAPVIGITPAWAGKSRSVRNFHHIRKDHPRVGGEKSASTLSSTRWTGSPPRGRGKVLDYDNGRSNGRITPAWAGKRRIEVGSFQLVGDHPRVGGEKVIGRSPISPSLGSPPRGRGKGLSLYFGTVCPGITPAWAGKRLKRSHRSGIFISGPIPFHSVLHRPAGSGGSRAGRDGSPAGQPQNTGPA